MTKRLVILATVFTFGLSAVAQAQNGARGSQMIEAGKAAAYRNAKYNGGEGASWKTGRNAHGFTGSHGGCRYNGNAGPNGYKLDRAC